MTHRQRDYHWAPGLSGYASAVETFASTLGALAAAAALLGVLAHARRVWQARRCKAHLAAQLQRLAKLDRCLAAVAIEVDQALGRGVGWYGPRTAPPALVGHLNYLYGIRDELDFTTAELRALNSSRSVKRMLSDIEELTELMRQAADAYIQGIWAAYRNTRGTAIPYETAGEGSPTATLRPEDVEKARWRKGRVQLLFRTTICRLWRNPLGVGYRNEWPAELRPQPDEPTGDLWQGMPRPLTGWPPLELSLRVRTG